MHAVDTAAQSGKLASRPPSAAPVIVRLSGPAASGMRASLRRSCKGHENGVSRV